MAVLYNHVHSHKLNDFNSEAKRIDANWKAAKTKDDLGRMKENDFLDRIAALSIIGKNVRQELGKCLTLRNGCGHPNSLTLRTNAVANHIEILLLYSRSFSWCMSARQWRRRSSQPLFTWTALHKSLNQLLRSIACIYVPVTNAR